MSSDLAISVNHVSKVYDLGLSGRATSLSTIAKQRMRHPFTRQRHEREQLRALDDVSFDVAAGEVVGVIGSNGAGKSTLLKVLSRITPPTSGHIDLAGNVGSLLEVGTGFHPELTGRENVYLNGTILGLPKAEIDRRLDAILAFAEVDRFLETPVKRYSSGMRVRLAFAVASHLDPEIMIIDEVLSVGDHAFQAKCIAKMRSIANDEGRTVLYVSHNLNTVEDLCPRSLLMVDGRLHFDGQSSETVAKYLHFFPHALSGEIPGVFDLRSADRSKTAYEPVFSRLELRPRGGPPLDRVQVGERVRVEIDVEGFDQLRDPTVGITVGTSTVNSLIRMTTQMMPLESAVDRRTRETIVLDIPSLSLTPGEYHLDIILKDGTSTVDFVRHAAEFVVSTADPFGTNYQFGAIDGLVTIPFSWELRPTDRTEAMSVEGETA